MYRFDLVAYIRRAVSFPLATLGVYTLALLTTCDLIEIAPAQDWPMRGGSTHRNNTPQGKKIADDWELGRYDRKTKKFASLRNIKWLTPIGFQAFGNPIVANGRIYLGSNNAAGHLKRFPKSEDVSCLICFRESDGKFLWQHSNMKLATGRVHDWPLQGICSTPVVEGKRLWYVSNRGEVVCLDTEAFNDNEDDGPIKNESVRVFRIRRYLQKTLGGWYIHPRLRTAFETAGLGLPDRASVRFNRAKNNWTVTKYDRFRSPKQRYVPMFEIDCFDRRLVIHKLQDQDATNRDKKKFEIENDLFPALAKNELDASVRTELARRGYELPKHVTLNVIEENKKWTFKAVVRGIEREFRLSMDDTGLTCRSVITTADRDEADVVWRFDMMKTLGTSQHNMANCSPAIHGDTLFVCTSNGMDESHINIPAVDAPSFIALDKTTGKVLWTDASPGKNILHGQWSSPSVGVFDGVAQVIFPGGDGWIYSFCADTWDQKNKKPILLWKFDGNPKTSKWGLGGRGTRNNAISMPVIYDGRVYIAMGQDPEHGEGDGHLWCIDPTMRGDVSAELAVKVVNNKRIPLAHRRIQAVNEEAGELAIPNPNSAVVWHYDQVDRNKDGKLNWSDRMHRTIATPAIKNDLLFIPDLSGLMHCLDAKTGKLHWTHDMFASSWSSPLIVDNKVYVGDEDGDITIYALSADPQKSFRDLPDKKTPQFYDDALRSIEMNSAVYTTPIVANGTLFISTKSHLFAIEHPTRKTR